jgi:nitrogen fixation/metabolism regulation signal transduction histidine kinase
MADDQKYGNFIGRIISFIGRFSIRGRIALSILLTFVLVLPAVSLSLIYLTNLISSIALITEQDFRLGRMANDLSFTMIDMQNYEKNYRIFGSKVEHDNIENLITHADSIIQSAQKIAPETEKWIINEISKKLDDYRTNFNTLVVHISENPAANRIEKIRSRLNQDFEEFELQYKNIQSQLNQMPPSAARDSVLAQAARFIDVFSIDQIVNFNSAGRFPIEASYIQIHLDTTREEFLEKTHQLEAMNWANMQIHKEESLKIEARAKRNIISILLLTGIICFFMIVILPVYIIRPITSLSAMLRRTSEGNFEIPSIKSNDEIGELASSYSEVIDRLRQYDDLKTKKIASQKRFIDRLLENLTVPVCILTKNLTASYYNVLFANLFGASVFPKAPEGGLDITKIPEMHDFTEEVRKKSQQTSNDFTFTISAIDGHTVSFKGRLVRNNVMNLESIVIVGASEKNGKEVH